MTGGIEAGGTNFADDFASCSLVGEPPVLVAGDLHSGQVAEVSDPYRLAPEALVSLPDELDGADMVESESLVLGRDDVLDEGDWVEP